MAQGQAKKFGKAPNARFERCVMAIKGQGKSKASAHAICNAQLPKKAKKK